MIKDIFERVEKIKKLNNSTFEQLQKAVTNVNKKYLSNLNDDDEVMLMLAYASTCKDYKIVPRWNTYEVITSLEKCKWLLEKLITSDYTTSLVIAKEFNLEQIAVEQLTNDFLLEYNEANAREIIYKYAKLIINGTN